MTDPNELVLSAAALSPSELRAEPVRPGEERLALVCRGLALLVLPREGGMAAIFGRDDADSRAARAVVPATPEAVARAALSVEP